jgi:hypothetical protein
MDVAVDGVCDPITGLAAAPEIATAVPSVSVPARYCFVGRKPVRAEPQ